MAVLPYAEQQRLEEIARKAEADRKKKLCPEKNIIFENDQVPVSFTLKPKIFKTILMTNCPLALLFTVN